MKQCSKCWEYKNSSEFYPAKDTHDKLHSWCKECKREYSRSYNKGPKRKEVVLKSVYKITPEEEQELVTSADGVCVICDREFNSDGYNTRPVKDHCHITKKMRGLICHGCNVGLGYFDHNTERLKTAVLYLEAFEALNER